MSCEVREMCRVGKEKCADNGLGGGIGVRGGRYERWGEADVSGEHRRGASGEHEADVRGEINEI